MGNRKTLKAYVRYDGTGRVLPGGPILSRTKPKVGNWKEIGAYQCCDPFCPVPVYGEDYIITGTVEGELGVSILISTNPFTGVVLEVAGVTCDSDPPNRILVNNVQTIPPGSVDFVYFLPWDLLGVVCAIAFRRVCDPVKSAWELGIFGG